MYIVCTKHNPQLPIFIRVKRGNPVLIFKTIEDGNFYLASRYGQYCDLKALPDAINENPKAFSLISRMLYLDTRKAVEMLLADPQNFPYEEFIVPLPKPMD